MEWSQSRETLHDGDEVPPAPAPCAATPRELTAKTFVDLAVLDSPRDRRPPRSIGGYGSLTKLADLGNVEVYVAEKKSAHNIVRRAIIKRIARWCPDFERAREMLLDEAMVTACFAHPNLTTLVDVGEDESAAFIALEHVEGTNLARLNTALRSRHQALPFELALFIVGEAMRGMHYAHTLRGPDGKELGVVLRERTPANLLISSTGNVKLCDFALALTNARRQNVTEGGVVKGSYAYLAPEYIAGDGCSVRSDIYALGVMLFELLSGRECFPTDTAYDTVAQIVGRGVVWRELEREGVPAKTMEIVARATNPCPGGRYVSAMEMVEAIEEQLVACGRAASSTILARTLAKHELFGGRGHDAIDEKKYAPSMRIVRGGSIVVSEAPTPKVQEVGGPPPLPPPSLLPIEEAPSSLPESVMNDAFDDTHDAPKNAHEHSDPHGAPVPAISARPDLMERGMWSESEIAGLFTDSSDASESPLSLAPVPLTHRKRPPIQKDQKDQRERVVVVRKEKNEASRVLIIAALIAIALFVAIVTYPI